MAESEFAHDEEAFFDALVGGNGARVRGHDFGDGGGAGSASDGDDAVHDVTLGENADKISVAEDGHGADIMFHHVAGGFEHGARGIDGIESAVLDEIAEGLHGYSFDRWSSGHSRPTVRPGASGK